MPFIDTHLVEQQAEVLRLLDQTGCTYADVDFSKADDLGLPHVRVKFWNPRTSKNMGYWSGDIEELRQLSLILKGGTDPRSR